MILKVNQMMMPMNMNMMMFISRHGRKSAS